MRFECGVYGALTICSDLRLFIFGHCLQKTRRIFTGLGQEVMENYAEVLREFHTNNIARHVDVSSLFYNTHGMLYL